MRPGAALAWAAAALALAGCEGWQSALDPQGPEARSIAWLFWLFTAVAAVVWLSVTVVLAVALLRRRAPRPDPMALDAAAERRHGRVLAGAVGLTLVILAMLTGLSFATQKVLFGTEEHTL